MLGTLINSAPDFLRYDHIIIDEAHEMSKPTVILLGLLKIAMVKRPKLKVTIMSATLDAKRFLDYIPGAVHYHVPGTPYPIAMYYLRQGPPPGEEAQITVAKVMDIHASRGPGDILVICAGLGEIAELQKYIKKALAAGTNGGLLTVCRMHANASDEEQDEAFAPGPFTADDKIDRKVILSTNIAEASVTFPDVKFVVDGGFVKVHSFDPRDPRNILQAEWISKASAKQRAGRAGRTQPGECFRMYTREQWEAMEPNAVPDLITGDMTSTIITLVKNGHNPLTFDYVQPVPALETLMRGLEEANKLGHIKNGVLTPLGRTCSGLAVDAHLGSILLASPDYGCSAQALSIVAMLDNCEKMSDLWQAAWTNEEKERLNASKAYWSHARGDHFTLLAICDGFAAAEEAGNEDAFSKKWHFSARLLKDAHASRILLAERLKMYLKTSLSLDQVPRLDIDDPAYVPKISRCLARGYFLRAARKVESDGIANYVGTKYSHEAELSAPLSCNEPDKKWVIYEQVFVPRNSFLTFVTAMKLEWLIEASPEYFLPGTLPQHRVEIMETLQAMMPMVDSTTLLKIS